MRHGGLRAAAAALVCVTLVTAASAADWVTDGPLGEGDQAYCVAISPEGLGFRLKHDQSSFDLAFFDVKASALALTGSSESGQQDVTALMRVNPDYLAISKGTVVISAESEDADIFFTSSDFHFYEALKTGTTITIKVGSKVPPTLSIDDAPGTGFTYSLVGSTKALTSAEACIAPAASTAGTSGAGPSFDCAIAKSPVEKLICADAELAALDLRLSGYYERAKARAQDAAFSGDNPPDPVEWFENNTRDDWNWREKNCADKPCLLLWYARRQALLQWFAESEYGFGDAGARVAQQFANGDTIISFMMTTYTGNSLWSVSTQTFAYLPDGEIQIVTESPLIYKALGQKGYFNGGGAFWFDTLRRGDGTILDFLRPNEATCLPRDEFFAKTNFVPAVQANITAVEICFYS